VYKQIVVWLELANKKYHQFVKQKQYHNYTLKMQIYKLVDCECRKKDKYLKLEANVLSFFLSSPVSLQSFFRGKLKYLP